MQVVAKQAGFYKGQRIRVGQEFTVVDGEKGKWFVPKEEYQAPAALTAKAPETMAEMARAVPPGPPVYGGKKDKSERVSDKNVLG